MITAKYLVNPYEELPFAYLFKIIRQVAAKMFVVIRIYFGFSPSPLTNNFLTVELAPDFPIALLDCFLL